jgi:hypothetical protein
VVVSEGEVAAVQRSKSELVLRPPRDDALDPLSADERHDYRLKKMRYRITHTIRTISELASKYQNHQSALGLRGWLWLVLLMCNP